MEREAENAALVAVGPPGTIAASAYASSPAVLRAAGGAAFPGTVPIIDYVSDAAVIVIDGAGEAHVLTPTAFADEWSPRNPANPLVKTSNEAYAAAWRQIVPSHGIPIKGNRPAPDAGISVELADAPAGASSAERVIGWLQLHKADIVAAESDFDIDRRAIAGAIAWEALENVRGTAELKAGRFAGPGKVHVKSSRVVPAGIATFGTVAEEAEAASILPTPKDTEAREKLLATPSGAIRYVGGIMKLGADIALRHGFDIDHDPRMLCFFFQAMDSAKWEKLLKAHKPGTPLETKESMSIWVTENMPLLESAVGTPAVPGAAAATASPTPAGPDPHGPATNELKDRAIKLGYEIAEWVTEADESGPAAITVRLVRDGNELTPSFETRPEPHFERPSSRTSMTMGRVLQNLEAPIGVWVLQDGELKAEWIRDSGGYMKFSFSITRASGTREPAPATPP